MSDPVANIIARLEARGFDPRSTGPDSWESRCPAHDGSRRNLSVKRGDDGRALLKCHHGGTCDHRSIVAALGLAESDLFLPREGREGRAAAPAEPKAKPKPEPKRRAYPTANAAAAAFWHEVEERGEPTEIRWWPYHDAGGVEVMQVWRYDFAPAGPDAEPKKSYRPVFPTGAGWAIGDPPGRLLPLYDLPALASCSSPKARRPPTSRGGSGWSRPRRPTARSRRVRRTGPRWPASGS